MILQGVEFEDYACFTRQFVPIKQGLNLLVGRNNAGKTALLKGLAVLSAIPLQFASSIPPSIVDLAISLQAYARTTAPEAYYRVEIIFQLQESDQIDLPDKERAKEIIRERETFLVYRFWILPSRNQDQVIFDQAELRIQGYPALPLVISEQGLNVLNFKFPEPGVELPPVLGTGKVNPGGKPVSTPDRKNHFVPIPKHGNFFDALAQFHRLRYVSPHRVVSPWINIQTADVLPDSAENLPIFLQTLYGRDRKAFQQIENLLISIFPEFEAVNPATERNQVQITLTRRDVNRQIPLTHCGTGVEQVLAIATFSVTAEKGAILLVDEPHSFLHPTAERQLVNFLRLDLNHQYVISTHSSVFINAVEAGRITHVEGPGKAFSDAQSSPEIGRILLDLGYRNSDILFYDTLIIVEGRSDKTILPLLLKGAGISPIALNAVGCPTMEGVPGDARSLQIAVHKHEKLLRALSQTQQPRLYLFDGDRSPEDIELLKKMRDSSGNNSVPVRFLPRTEIENYLLVPEAIVAALQEEALLADVQIEVTETSVREKIDSFLKSDDKVLFPHGKNADPSKTVKGSVLLQKLYASVENLVYDKDKSGALIAGHLTVKNQPALSELRDLLKDILQT